MYAHKEVLKNKKKAREDRYNEYVGCYIRGARVG